MTDTITLRAAWQQRATSAEETARRDNIRLSDCEHEVERLTDALGEMTVERDCLRGEVVLLREAVQAEKDTWESAAYQILSDIYRAGHQDRHNKIGWEESHQALHRALLASPTPPATVGETAAGQ